MKRQTKLVNKVKHLLRKTNAPRWLHHYGPKTYELWQHIFALFVKEYCQLSYRRTTWFLRDLGCKTATKSTLQRYAAKLDIPFWKTMLNQTLGRLSRIGAIDGTGLDKTNACWHYIKRIDGKPKQGYKLSILSAKNKIISLRLRAKPAHDIKDVKYLLNNAKKHPSTLGMDRAYDAEWLHKYCNNRLGIRSIAPIRKNSFKGYFRKRLRNNFPQKLYNKRSRIESTFHALKQKFGASISSKRISVARTQIYCRVILHNIFMCFWRLGTLPYYSKFFKPFGFFSPYSGVGLLWPEMTANPRVRSARRGHSPRDCGRLIWSTLRDPEVGSSNLSPAIEKNLLEGLALKLFS